MLHYICIFINIFLEGWTLSITKYLFDALNNGTELYPPMQGALPVNSYDILQGKINSNRFLTLAEDMRITADTDILIVAKSVNTTVAGGIYSSSSPALLKGLYYIPAVLHTDGTLSFTENRLPYFNEEFLEGDIVFGDCARAHGYFGANPRLISAIYANGTWEAYIRLATAYFEEVCGVPYNECYITNRADNSSFIFDQNCYIIPARPVKGTKPMLRLYARIFKAGVPNKLYGDLCAGNDEDISFITLSAEEKAEFIRKVSTNWIINSALARVPARPIIIGSDMSPSLRLAETGDDLASYWAEVKSSVQSLPAYNTDNLSPDGIFAGCARRYGVSFSSVNGCIDRIYRELSALSVLNDRVVNEVKKHEGLITFPVKEGKRITFAASQTLMKCEELEKTLRERRMEWEMFIGQLPRRVRTFGGLASVREERKRLFTQFMTETDTFIDPEMSPQQILNAFTDMAAKNNALMKETALKKQLLDTIGEYSEYGIDFFSDKSEEDTFLCTEQDINRLIMKKVTPTMFWLAVHYYECIWASDPENNPYTLSPVIIAPYQKIAEQFEEFDSIPLLILDHADSISPEYACGLFALAKTAILICDGEGASPKRTLPAGTDILLAIRSGAVAYADEYCALEEKGLSVSFNSVADCFRS